MEEINKIIGKNLLKLRKNAKLTQLELADKFNYSDKSISKWENGESLPSVEILHQLATFYGKTLNDLTTEDDIISKPNTNLKPESSPKMFDPKPIITLLAVCAVWVVATILYVCLSLIANISYPLCFLWATIPSCIVLIIFNSFWGKWRYFFPILSGLLWSMLVCIHVQLLAFEINVWPIYIIGAPLQVAIILWGALVKKPFWYNKQLRENKKHEKQAKKEAAKQQQEELKKDAE